MIRKSNSLNSSVVFILVLKYFGLLTTTVESAHILAVETVAGKSHWNFFSAVLQSLVDAGHNVTAFTPFPGNDRENYTSVDISTNLHPKIEMDFKEIILFRNPIDIISTIPSINRLNCNSVYENSRFKDMIMENKSKHFDLIIMEPLRIDCMSYLANTLNLPIVYVIPSPMHTFAERTYTGQILNPACVSNLIAYHAVPKTFIQRFTNTALLAYSILTIIYFKWNLKITDSKQYDLSPTINPAIIFQNSHYITEAPRPTVSNLIDIGGIHLKTAKSLPKDILDFIEDSPHGVIFFTFGSTVKMSSLPDYIEIAFKEALAQVPQKVLWKYEGEMKDKPKNVMIKKWFPQRDILLHPNVKLFISHGGMSGVYEAVDGGVPVLGFPVFFDQPRNIEHLVHNNMAISMDLLTVNKEKLLSALLELINNKKYTKNAKIASKHFKDRPITPEQSVVYWTEYVIQHKGAPHLKSHGFNLAWYQYLLLDEIAVLLIFMILLLFIVFRIFKFVYKCTIKCLHKDKIKIH